MFDVKTGKVLYLDGKYAEAAEYFRTGAGLGDAEAAFNYGYMLYHGIGTERSYTEAKSYFGFAAGIVGEANYNLAVMYLHGVGVKRDYRKCYSYMRDAAEMGVIEAQLYLGVAHTLGSLFEPDITSISLIPYHTPEYRDPYALLEGEVPDMEEDEERRIRAVRQDLRSAFEWFRAAAKHAPDYVEELSRRSKYLFARCFLDGVGVDYNRDKANELMLLAAADGSEEALYYLQTEAPYVLDKLTDKVYINNIRKTERLSGP